MDIKTDLQIDKFNLDQEWEKQPLNFFKWAEEAVNAQSKRDRLKEQLEILRAELDQEIRSNPTKFGLEKVTESAIQSAIQTNVKYKQANSDFLDSIRDSKILDVGRDAFDHKKKALEKLTDLYLSGYWADKIGSANAKDFVTGVKSDKISEGLAGSKRFKK